MKVHSLRRSFCLSTDTLLEAYTSTQSLLEELRLDAESRQSWLFPKPSTRGVRNSTCSDPLGKERKPTQLKTNVENLLSMYKKRKYYTLYNPVHYKIETVSLLEGG